MKKNLQTITRILLALSLLVIFGCEQGTSFAQYSESARVVTENTHGDLLHKGVVKGELSTSLPHGTIYQCVCGHWHVAVGGEKLYAGKSCDNEHGNTYALQLKSNSTASFMAPAIVQLFNVSGDVNYIDANGNSHSISNDTTITTTQISTTNGSLWISTSAKVSMGGGNNNDEIED